MGLKVLVIDADLRNPSLHAKLGLQQFNRAQQLSDRSLRPARSYSGLDSHNLFFMPSGPLPPNAADLLGSPRVFSLLSVGLEVFDLIVIDGPPVMGPR